MAEKKSNPASRHLRIRKYPNRRYYDTTRSRHLTLEEIHKSICDGYEIEVTDSRTGNDITGKVLAQIIIDLDPPKLDIFPVALLHRLLRANQQLVTDFTQKYFNAALTAFLDSQRKFEQTVRQTLGLQAGASATPTDWSKLLVSAATSAGATAAAPAVVLTASAAQDLQPVVEDLRKQVRELETRLSDTKPAGKSARNRGKSA